MSILPSGYKRLLYIESTGTQYVDTGWKPAYNSRLIARVSGVPNSSTYILGVRDVQSATAVRQFGLFRNSATTLRYDYFGTNVSATVSDSTGETVIDMNANKATAYGVTITNTAVSSGRCNNSLLLFGLNNVGTPRLFSSYKMHSCKAYDDGVLVRNFVPCQNDAGVVGLYDTVNGVFYSDAAGGTFVAGPEWGYIELEYIQSSGTQYIDTGVAHSASKRFVLKAALEFTTVAPANQIMGFCGSKGCGIGISGSTWWEASSFGTASVGEKYATEYVADGANYIRTVNGMTSSGTRSEYSFTANLFLFASNASATNASKAYYCSCRMFDAKVIVDGTLVRDYIPVKLSDGTVGLLDKVSGVFYGNAGTGSFVAGPVAKVTEYAKVEYIESTGEQYIDTGFIPVSGATAELTFEATVVDASVESWVAGVFDLSASGYPRMRAGLVSGAYYTADTNGFTYNGTPGEYTVATGGVSKAGCTLSLYLFAQHEAANGAAHMANSKYRLYGAKFFVSGVLAMDLIPAVANGVPGMVDQLNNRFYPSNTAVMLVAGPEITDIEPAVTPEEFIAPYVDFSNILLMWSAVPGAEGYTITRDGELIADTPNTYLFDGGLDMKTQYEYGVAAYNSAGESEPVATVAETTEFKLITDRTNADVQAVLAAINTGVLPENWFFGLKGAYNVTDLNRVESAVLFVIERLKIAGWYLAVQSKYWTMTDFPTASEMHRYLENVRLLRSALPVGIPAVPADMDRLTFTEANTIEQILEMLDAAVTNIMANVYYSNELYSGEV